MSRVTDSLTDYITYYEKRMADIKDRLTSIEKRANDHPREIERLTSELLDIGEHVARWKSKS